MKKPRMSKKAKETLEAMAKEPKLYIYPPHEHNSDVCEGCANEWNEGERFRRRTAIKIEVPGPERVVYRNSWPETIITLTIASLATSLVWFLNPRIVTKTIEVPVKSTVELDQIRDMQDELARDQGAINSAFLMLDEGKFHSAYKILKQNKGDK